MPNLALGVRQNRALAFELLVVVTPTHKFVPHACGGAAGNRTGLKNLL
jgi:hypothetical protein